MLDMRFRKWNAAKMLDSASLQVFVRIVDSGSLSAAARSLGMPKSSVSRALRRLEDAAGAVLLERTSQHVKLTDAGRLLLRHGRRILDDVVEAEDALGGLVGAPSGDLTVSATTTFAAGPLAAMLPAFLEAYPDVRVRLMLVARPVDLLAEDVDVSIRMGLLPDSALIARRVSTVPLWLCTSPKYSNARPPAKTFADLCDHRVLYSHEGQQTLSAKDANGATETITLVPRLAAVEPVVLLNLTLMGAGIASLPSVYAQEGIAKGDLVRVLPELDFGSVDIHALYPSHRSLSAKVRVFLDALVAHLAAKGPEGFVPQG